MSSFKVKFRPSTIAGKEGTVYYQVYHGGQIRFIKTIYRIFSTEWDSTNERFRVKASPRSAHIQRIRSAVRRDIKRLVAVVKEMEEAGQAYTVDDILEEYRKYIERHSLLGYCNMLAHKLIDSGRIRTSETYIVMMRSFVRFLNAAKARGSAVSAVNIMLDDVTHDLVEEYEVFLTRSGVQPNTISFYMRILRAVFNHAIDDGMIPPTKPFKRVYTGIGKTQKRALSTKWIKRLRRAKLVGHPHLEFCRDMFMLSFYFRGMSFIDMAYLKYENLKYGYLTYRRHKTGQLLSIKWTKEMEEIVDKYHVPGSDYMLSVISEEKSARTDYMNAMTKINRNLKKLARILHIEMPLTLYVARHSWATIARSKGVPVSVISEGMGHDSELTTQIYLASISSASVDRANSRVINSI